QLLVDAGHEVDVVGCHERGLALEREVEASERGAGVAGDEGPRAQAGPGVGPVPVEGEAHERLHAGEQDLPPLDGVAGRETELASRGMRRGRLTHRSNHTYLPVGRQGY